MQGERALGCKCRPGKQPSARCRRLEVNLSHAFAGQNVGVAQGGDRLWLVTFMQYDLGFFDDETCRLELIEDPFGPRLSPMSPEYEVRARQDSNLRPPA